MQEMGTASSRLEDDTDDELTATSLTGTTKTASKSAKKGGRKRKNGSPSGGNSPSKVVKLDTAKYVYEKLFVNGEDSDITVCALENEWKLHKFYLKQAKYFDALLNGEWKDSKRSIFELQIPDERITVNGLNTVFGSFYDNEIAFDESELESIVAAASLLQLESVLSRATEEMLATMTDGNLLRFLECSHRYGLSEVRNTAFDCIKRNFWRLAQDVEFLARLPEEALARLMSSPDLVVVEGELDLYKILRTWIFLQSETSALPSSSGNANISSIEKACLDFYTNIRSCWTVPSSSSLSAGASPASSSSRGTSSPPDSPPSDAPSASSAASSELSLPLSTPYALFLRYAELLGGLRLHALFTATANIELLEKDALIPKSLINAVLADSFRNLLASDEDLPQTREEISGEAFLLSSSRFGRQLQSFPKCWRWTGFQGGLNILLNYNRGVLSMRRNVRNQPCVYSLNLRNAITINYRVIITDKECVVLFDSERKSVSLQPDMSCVIARLEGDEMPEPPINIHLFVLSGAVPKPSFVYIQEWQRGIETGAARMG